MAKRNFLSFNGFPCEPTNLNDNLWFYVDPRGIHVIAHQCDSAHISWRRIKRALEDRKLAPKRKKKKA